MALLGTKTKRFWKEVMAHDMGNRRRDSNSAQWLHLDRHAGQKQKQSVPHNENKIQILSHDANCLD